VPIVITLHRFDPKITIDRITSYFIASIADIIIVHAQFIKNDLISYLGGSKKLQSRVTVIEHGSYYTEKYCNEIFKARSNFSKPVFLFFGTISPRKGLHILLKAFKEFCLVKHPELKNYCRLYVAGYIPTYSRRYGNFIIEYVRYLQRLGLKVKYFGAIPETILPKLFELRAIAILPYIEMSAASGPLHHAIGYCMPIIATTTKYFKEVFQDGGAILVKPGSVEELLNAIEKILFNKDVQKEIFIKLLQKVLRRYSWYESAKKHIYIYLKGIEFLKKK